MAGEEKKQDSQKSINRLNEIVVNNNKTTTQTNISKATEDYLRSESGNCCTHPTTYITQRRDTSEKEQR